jgi:chromatin remodeling complex protein RSC6
VDSALNDIEFKDSIRYTNRIIMVRTTKPTSTTSKSTPVPVVTSVVPEVSPPVPVVKKTKVPKNSVVSTTPVPNEPTIVPIVSTTESVSSDVMTDESIASKLSNFNTKLQQLVILLASLRNEYKNLEKYVNKEVKASQKASSKKVKRSGNRQPSGFVCPTLISDELAAFLGKPVGTEMARTAVSKEINQYIRTNNLQDKENGRQINADAKLATLLKLTNNDVLTYFNLQKFMKIHFTKNSPTV